MTTLLPPRLDRRGFALESTLLVLLLLSFVMVAFYAGAVTTIRTTNVDYRAARVQYATEGGTEAIMAQLQDNLQDGVLTDEEIAGLQRPSVPGFAIDTFWARKVGDVVQEVITDGHFTGLYSLTQRMEIFTSVRDATNNRSSVLVSVKAQAIPLFQFGVFFEKDLEATNGPPMTFAGWVHSNGNVYLSSGPQPNAWYTDRITTPNSVVHDRKDHHSVLDGVYIDDASGADVQLLFDSRLLPGAAAFRARSEADFDSRLRTSAHGVDSLKLPLPEGLSPVAVLQGRLASDDDQTREAKFAWKADWYIEVPLARLSSSGSNLCPHTTEIRSPGKVGPSIPDCRRIFSWTFEAFYEGRERRFADVLDIDVGELRLWVGSTSDRRTEIFYVTLTGTPRAGDAAGDGFYPVIRLINGGELPNRLTFATDRPLYLQGDYNRVNWVPAAVAGDAITWLSNAWTDDAHQSPGETAASESWIHAAVLAGHSPTPCDHEVPGCAGGYSDFYGGGIENFPRFLENWSGVYMHYVGSLVSLHWAAIPTGTWNGDYYTPPRRDWQFDLRFRDPANLPPGTPVVGNVIHTAFRPVY